MFKWSVLLFVSICFQTFSTLKEKLASYKPRKNKYSIETANIMLSGAVGSGKSSTCNTVNSIFESSVKHGLAATGKHARSLTSKVV